ncbi:protein phosphatase 1 regulatory subunit 37-like isoform X2 [Physella acuta]|uniref:protein phosphatase 1 regulatory subunit 37-like isoform X2 n=1 Tax=Physella acuta TaxID=109671 RepID=UPI0027DDC0AD|nr:protein phosphatase 1 regulatory subunit 37-like isoform X2 [Physella acuta]
MAEVANETVSQDLPHDIFISSSASSSKTTAESSVIVNNEPDDPNTSYMNNQNSKQSNAGHGFENGIIIQPPLDEEMKEEQVQLISMDTVIWNNIENSTKHNELSTSSTNSSMDRENMRIDHFSESSSNNSSPLNTVSGSPKAATKCDKRKLQKKEKKGITFPKDTFISGYFEPPDPWKNAPPWTSDELVNAYKKSCEIHGSKPIIKIIQQLQTITHSSKREELFTLKGEKLDHKQCESLEEIFRRVQYKILDLEATHLDDECATAVFDMIEYYESACQLNISFNKNIQARGWQACSRLVRRTPTLTYLDIRSCDLNERTIPIFGRALKLGCHLTILHMENMSLSGRPLVILVAALKMNEILQELFLAENKLMPTDGVQLGHLLRYNHKLSLLDLRNNHLQDVGTSHLCDGLLEQNTARGLRTLVLWNNQINYQAMPALGRALATSECIETLNIGHNAITNEGVHLLKDGLLKTNSLLRLGLQGTKISDEGAVALAEYIADSTILLRIDLRENDIKTGGLMALSHAMRVNTSVTRIDLDKDPKKESGMKDYAEQQSRLLRDILTFQQRNVQTAMEREELERKKLEERAEAAAAARKSALENTQQTTESSNEAFSLIEEEELTDKDAGQEKCKKEAANSKLKDVGTLEEVDWSTVEPEAPTQAVAVDKVHSRPSQLFPYKHLRPQETLDSPLPTNDNPLIAVITPANTCPQTSPQLYRAEKNLLSSLITASPPEMILSPQYFPKQIVRKIFSVSRVNESQLSSSPTPSQPLSGGFDPLNISSVPLVSASTSLPPMSSPIMVAQSSLSLAQHSKSWQETSVSPSSSLFQDLADQSVKHLVSPDGEQEVKTVLANDSKPVYFDNCGGNTDSDNLAASSISENLSKDSTELKDDKTLNDSGLVHPKYSCDRLEASLSLDHSGVVESGKIIGGPVLHTERKDTLVDSASAPQPTSENHESVGHADISKGTNNLESFPNEPSNGSSSLIKAGLENGEHSSEKAPKTFFDSNSVSTTSDNFENSYVPRNPQAAILHLGAGDILQPVESLAKEEDSQHINISTAEVPFESHKAFSHEFTNGTLSSRTTDAQLDEVKLSNVNNSNSSSSMLISVDLDDKQFSFSPENEKDGDSFISKEKTELDSLNKSQDNALVESFVTNDSIDNINDGIDNDIENVEMSLDEEPWLAIGADNDGSGTDKLDPLSKQPDFFTTLSMNGLTQELASALTSLDGSTGYYDDDTELDS